MDSTNASEVPQGGRVPSGDKSLLQKFAELEADARYRAEQPGVLNSAVGVVKDTAAKMMPWGLNVEQGVEGQEGRHGFRRTDSNARLVLDNAIDQPNSDSAAGQESPARDDATSNEVPLGEGPLEVAALRNSEADRPEAGGNR